MILKDVNKTIFLNAGHHLNDPGHVNVGGLRENDQVRQIRDLTIEMLKFQGFKVESVPDNFNLRESIDLVNVLGKDLNSGLALDIHLNANGSVNKIVNGTEIYSGTSLKSREIANILSKNIAKELGTSDSGYRPDTWTAAGSLGWVRQTNMWSCVVECCYMTDPRDLSLLMNGGHAKVAKGIAKGVCELYGLNFLEDISEDEKLKEQNKIMELMLVVISLLQKLILLKSSKSNSLLGGIYKLWNN